MNYEIPAFIPPGVNVDVHMKLANDQWKKDPSTGAFMSWFHYKVRNKGPWDYKQKHPEWEDFGNFHYSAVGTAGQLTEQLLLRAAGFAQGEAKTRKYKWGHWFWLPPYGDDPKDQKWIKMGILYAKSKGY
ncbi:polymorphic toxin type 44 domain-containing protein [Pseudomonas syringae group genomosp. 7]|uniref:polymorphic toxin type 44 domain-containing protein n=1 Tax=Pseudomonas syringae group genomosp. 7 TaxID=251699 RepID=UPI0006D5DEE9|nr:polymorphic toxin type 44 domain-containing protein [Pseudomonas syringae group genomosp. 7]